MCLTWYMYVMCTYINIIIRKQNDMMLNGGKSPKRGNSTWSWSPKAWKLYNILFKDINMCQTVKIKSNVIKKSQIQDWVTARLGENRDEIRRIIL